MNEKLIQQISLDGVGDAYTVGTAIRIREYFTGVQKKLLIICQGGKREEGLMHIQPRFVVGVALKIEIISEKTPFLSSFE